MEIFFESHQHSLIAIAAATGLYVLLNLIVRPLAVWAAGKTANQLDDLLLNKRLLRQFSLVVVLALLLSYVSTSEQAQLLHSLWGMRIIEVLLILATGRGTITLLDVAAAIYERTGFSKEVSIKGYLQLAKLAILLFVALLTFAALNEQSIGYYLGGLGAALALLLLVFRDTILSFLATLQINQGRVMKVGDWVEMPEYGVDGAVTDIDLHMVKIENWNKTISTVPTLRIIDTPLRNWRGMERSGGRRIKRAMHIDMSSIRFLSEAEQARFSRFRLLRDYMDQKRAETAEYNATQPGEANEIYNLRRLTNIGTFRAYVLSYLESHPRLNTKDFTCLVRQLPPSPEGIPIELYVFTNTTDWIAYEEIQSDLFDHLLAMLSEFGLRPYQTGLLEGLARQGVVLYELPTNPGTDQ